MVTVVSTGGVLPVRIITIGPISMIKNAFTADPDVKCTRCCILIHSHKKAPSHLKLVYVRPRPTMEANPSNLSTGNFHPQLKYSHFILTHRQGTLGRF